MPRDIDSWYLIVDDPMKEDHVTKSVKEIITPPHLVLMWTTNIRMNCWQSKRFDNTPENKQNAIRKASVLSQTNEMVILLEGKALLTTAPNSLEDVPICSQRKSETEDSMQN